MPKKGKVLELCPETASATLPQIVRPQPSGICELQLRNVRLRAARRGQEAGVSLLHMKLGRAWLGDWLCLGSLPSFHPHRRHRLCATKLSHTLFSQIQCNQ